MSVSFCVLNKPGGGKIHIQSLSFTFFANVHFEAKLRKVIRKDGDPFFDV